MQKDTKIKSTESKKTRRFIAGAVCPECQKMDKIITYKQDGEDIAECVSCGYVSQRPKEDEVRAINAEKDAQGVVQVSAVKIIK